MTRFQVVPVLAGVAEVAAGFLVVEPSAEPTLFLFPTMLLGGDYGSANNDLVHTIIGTSEEELKDSPDLDDLFGRLEAAALASGQFRYVHQGSNDLDEDSYLIGIRVKPKIVKPTSSPFEVMKAVTHAFDLSKVQPGEHPPSAVHIWPDTFRNPREPNPQSNYIFADIEPDPDLTNWLQIMREV